MKNKIVQLNSGTIEMVTYDGNEEINNRVLHDVNEKAHGFKNDIRLICFAKFNMGKTIDDILDDFLESVNTGIICAFPHTIQKEYPHYGMCEDSVYETKRFLNKIEYILKQHNFVKVVFNRSVSQHNEVAEMFIYNNEDGSSFVDLNSDIIDRVITVDSE